MTKPDDNSFQGEHKAAMVRLRRLAALACDQLPTETINLASFHLAVYLDVSNGTRSQTADVTAELEREQTCAGRRPPRRHYLNAADRKMLRQFGIESTYPKGRPPRA